MITGGVSISEYTARYLVRGLLSTGKAEKQHSREIATGDTVETITAAGTGNAPAHLSDLKGHLWIWEPGPSSNSTGQKEAKCDVEFSF